MVRETTHIVKLAEVANGLQLTQKEILDPKKKELYVKRMDLLRARIDQLITTDVDGLCTFVTLCRHPDLSQFALQQFVKKIGILCIEDIEIVLKTILASQDSKSALTRGLLRDLFASAHNVLTVPRSATAEDLIVMIRHAHAIIDLILEFNLNQFDVIPQLHIFTSEITDGILALILQGHPVKGFFDEVNVISNFECDLIVAITQEDAIPLSTLCDVMQTAHLFSCEECKSMINIAPPFIGTSIIMFIGRFIAMAEGELAELTLDQLKMIARNLISRKDKVLETERHENFVIRHVLPLLRSDDDPSEVAKAFHAWSGTHRFVKAFLESARCISITQLEELARCVKPNDTYGDLAVDALVAANEKFFQSAVDLEKILYPPENENNFRCSIIIGTGGVMDPLIAAEIEAMIYKQQSDGGDETIH
jgi:hypothetical protein